MSFLFPHKAFSKDVIFFKKGLCGNKKVVHLHPLKRIEISFSRNEKRSLKEIILEERGKRNNLPR